MCNEKFYHFLTQSYQNFTKDQSYLLIVTVYELTKSKMKFNLLVFLKIVFFSCKFLSKFYIPLNIRHNQALFIIIVKYFSSLRNLSYHHVEKFVKHLLFIKFVKQKLTKPPVLHKHTLLVLHMLITTQRRLGLPSKSGSARVCIAEAHAVRRFPPSTNTDCSKAITRKDEQGYSVLARHATFPQKDF